MYLGMILLLMAALPILSIVAEYWMSSGGLDFVQVAGRWFVFWSVGVRLVLAGLRQTVQPAFTAQTIFRISDPEALKVVQELGFGNLAIGLLGIVAVLAPAWLMPAAVAGALFYGLAGIKHVLNAEWTRLEAIAMVSDLAIAAVLIAYVVATLVGDY